MHLRIFEYTSNALIASFEYMELILASGTLNFRLLLRSCLSTDRVFVINLICSTFQPWCCITVLIVPRRDAYWFSGVLLTLIRYRSQTSDILLCLKTVCARKRLTVIENDLVCRNTFVVLEIGIIPRFYSVCSQELQKVRKMSRLSVAGKLALLKNTGKIQN